MEKEYNGKNVTIMLCSQCNNNCEHCYVKYSGRFTDEELRYLIPKLKEKYRILLNGTEPIMFPEYYKYFKMVDLHRIMTNGIKLLKEPETMNLLKENDITNIWISYHFGIQNDISQIKTDDLNRLIKQLKENDFIVKLMCSLSTDNYENIENYCYKTMDLGADKIKFTNFIYQGHAAQNFEETKLLNQNQINEVLEKLELLRSKISKEKLEIERCGTFGPFYKKNNFRCLAGNDMVVITPDRKVYDCVFDISEDSCIGYMDDDKIMINDDIHCDSSKCKVLCKYNKIGANNGNIR